MTEVYIKHYGINLLIKRTDYIKVLEVIASALRVNMPKTEAYNMFSQVGTIVDSR